MGLPSDLTTNNEGYFLTLYFCARASSLSLTNPNCSVFSKFWLKALYTNGVPFLALVKSNTFGVAISSETKV